MINCIYFQSHWFISLLAEHVEKPEIRRNIITQDQGIQVVTGNSSADLPRANPSSKPDSTKLNDDKLSTHDRYSKEPYGAAGGQYALQHHFQQGMIKQLLVGETGVS